MKSPVVSQTCTPKVTMSAQDARLATTKFGVAGRAPLLGLISKIYGVSEGITSVKY